MLWEFTIEGLRYELRIDVKGEASLILVGGRSRKGAVAHPNIYDLYRHEPRVDDVDLVSNGYSVLMRAKQLIMTFVHKFRPWRLSISATTNRKAAVYRRIIERTVRDIDGYHLVEAPIGTFSIYKLVAESA